MRPYIQIIHKENAVYSYCDKPFDIYSVHYIAKSPATSVFRAKLMADVPVNMYNIDSTPLTLEIFRRKAARRRKELIQVIHKFPPASKNNISSLVVVLCKHYRSHP